MGFSLHSCFLTMRPARRRGRPRATGCYAVPELPWHFATEPTQGKIAWKGQTPTSKVRLIQGAIPNGVDICAFRGRQHSGEILARESLGDRGALVRCHPGHCHQRGRKIDMRRDGAALLAAGVGGEHPGWAGQSGANVKNAIFCSNPGQIPQRDRSAKSTRVEMIKRSQRNWRETLLRVQTGSSERGNIRASISFAE